MHRLLNVALLSAALMTPVALRAQDHKDDRKYHDKEHNDDHRWDSREDKAYRTWAKENHRKYTKFEKLKEDDQQNYWKWRHEHSDESRH